MNTRQQYKWISNREKRHVFIQSFVRSVVHSLLASFLVRLYSLSTETASVIETQNQEHGLSQNSHPVHSASVRDERCEDLGIRTGQGRKPSRYKAQPLFYSSPIVQELCESRWPSWAVRPNEPCGFRGLKSNTESKLTAATYVEHISDV